ncbi:MAG: hypothetical protein GXO64_04035, partial [Candidatus Micrarchaeota archaeon]|nr:hypothetical protein [Candidatus Micrarchaeota archaeon]
MFGNKTRKKDRNEDEMKDERIDLEKIIKENLDDAKENLDNILSEKKMEFCSRCGKKIGSRLEWGGKCIEDGCTNLICEECWNAGKRKCRIHAENKKKEKNAEDDVTSKDVSEKTEGLDKGKEDDHSNLKEAKFLKGSVIRAVGLT